MKRDIVAKSEVNTDRAEKLARIAANDRDDPRRLWRSYAGEM